MPKHHKYVFQHPTVVSISSDTNHTETTEEHAAYLCEVHQPGDARLVPVQSREGFLPFRQDLIPPGLAGHSHGRDSRVGSGDTRRGRRQGDFNSVPTVAGSVK